MNRKFAAMLLMGATALSPLAACSAESPAATVAEVSEDHPDFNCNTMGNRICGDPDRTHAAEAWDAWDKAEGWRLLPADPDLNTRVDYVGTSTSATAPTVDTRTEAAIPAREGWYVFRTAVIDPYDGSCDVDSCDPNEGE